MYRTHILPLPTLAYLSLRCYVIVFVLLTSSHLVLHVGWCGIVWVMWLGVVGVGVAPTVNKLTVNKSEIK